MTDLEFIEQTVAQKGDKFISLADEVWEYAELPYAEFRSAKALCGALAEEGFTVEEGVAGMPTSFVGRWKGANGGYTVGILGEFDALDILSQKAGCPEKSPIKEGAPGHGCGHNLLGAGALGAAVAVKDYLAANSLPGRVIYYGCAAEEGAGAKQFMARARLFDCCDFIYTWHPATRNGVDANPCNAIMGANFEFKGLSAHAGGSPHLGRSALDAAELMSVGVNYLREHIIDGARVHYAYVDAGGVAPNVVQDHSLVKYEVRSPKVSQVKALFERVVKVARGAALMTETTMDYEVTMAFSDYQPNDALAAIADACMREVGAPKWDEEDFMLAKKFLSSYNETTLEAIRESLTETYGPEKVPALWERPLDCEIQPYIPGTKEVSGGSTDVGDVTCAVPCLNLHIATACIGNVGHTWQMTAQARSSIGRKGLLTAVKALALSALRTMNEPEAVERAKALVLARNGGKYQCPLPDGLEPPVGRY